jgi:hypothetical protein
MNMNLNWVMEHKNGQVTKKRDKQKGTLNPYHTRDKHTKRDNVKTIALQDENEVPMVLVDVPDGAQPFQRHRVIPINYFGRFHEVQETVPGHVENGRYVADKTVAKSYPEVNYDDVWIVGYRSATEVYFKALYSDGKIDEHHAWNEKPWLYEPEWFPEEAV